MAAASLGSTSPRDLPSFLILNFSVIPGLPSRVPRCSNSGLAGAVVFVRGHKMHPLPHRRDLKQRCHSVKGNLPSLRGKAIKRETRDLWQHYSVEALGAGDGGGDREV